MKTFLNLVCLAGLDGGLGGWKTRAQEGLCPVAQILTI